MYISERQICLRNGMNRTVFDIRIKKWFSATLLPDFSVVRLTSVYKLC